MSRSVKATADSVKSKKERGVNTKAVTELIPSRARPPGLNGQDGQKGESGQSHLSRLDDETGQIEVRYKEVQVSEGSKAVVRSNDMADSAAIKPDPIKLDPIKLVVLSHPHPLHGGTMNNKVVTTLERAFQTLGYITVAYNFRGVGQSSGVHDHGVGEVEDLLQVVEWAKARFKSTHLTLAGFSFGSYVLLRAYKLFNESLAVDALCTVAPPVGLYDFSAMHPLQAPWVLVQGGQDEVVPAVEIAHWALSGEVQPDIYWRADASHFFHGELIWLRSVIRLAYSH